MAWRGADGKLVLVEYAERLSVPLRWWVQTTMLVVSLWLAVAVVDTLSGAAVLGITAVAAALCAAFLVWLGSARIEVADGEFRAGRAHIPLHLVGKVEPLDADATRRVAGVDADARAYLLLRPYLKRAVKVAIDDPADPTPYWLVSSRHPEALADALTALPRRR